MAIMLLSQTLIRFPLNFSQTGANFSHILPNYYFLWTPLQIKDCDTKSEHYKCVLSESVHSQSDINLFQHFLLAWHRMTP